MGQVIKATVTISPSATHLRTIHMLHALMPGVPSKDMQMDEVAITTRSWEHFVHSAAKQQPTVNILKHDNLKHVIFSRNIHMLNVFVEERSKSTKQEIRLGVTFLQAVELTSMWFRRLLEFDDPLAAMRAFTPFMPSTTRRNFHKKYLKGHHLRKLAYDIGSTLIGHEGKLGPLAVEIWKLVADECKFDMSELGDTFPFAGCGCTYYGWRITANLDYHNPFICNHMILNEFDKQSLVDSLSQPHSSHRWNFLAMWEAWEGILYLLHDDKLRAHMDNWKACISTIRFKENIPQLIALLKFQDEHQDGSRSRITLTDDAFIQVARVDREVALDHCEFSSLAAVGSFDVTLFNRIEMRRGPPTFTDDQFIDLLIQMILLVKVKKEDAGNSQHDNFFNVVRARAIEEHGDNPMDIQKMLAALGKFELFLPHLLPTWTPPRTQALETYFTVGAFVGLLTIAWTFTVRSAQFITKASHLLCMRPVIAKVIATGDAAFVRLIYEDMCYEDMSSAVSEPMRRNIYLSDTEPEITRITARMAKKHYDLTRTEPVLMFTESFTRWNTSHNNKPLITSIQHIANELTREEFNRLFGAWERRRNSHMFHNMFLCIIDKIRTVIGSCGEGQPRASARDTSLLTILEMDHVFWFNNEFMDLCAARAMMECVIPLKSFTFPEEQEAELQRRADKMMVRIVSCAITNSYGNIMRDMAKRYPAHFGRAIEHDFGEFQLANMQENVSIVINEFKQN